MSRADLLNACCISSSLLCIWACRSASWAHFSISCSLTSFNSVSSFRRIFSNSCLACNDSNATLHHILGVVSLIIVNKATCTPRTLHHKGPATRNDFVNDIVDDARADAIFATLKTVVDDRSSISLRVAGPLGRGRFISLQNRKKCIV